MENRIDDFEKEFLRQMTIAMAGAGRTLNNEEIVIIKEFVKQTKANNLILVDKK